MQQIASVTQGSKPQSGKRSTHIQFIVSDELDYSKKICRDGGPRYTESLGLPWSGISSISQSDATHFIIDNDIGPAEVEIVRELIERQSSAVLLKVVSPYWSRVTRGASRSAYVKLIEEYSDRRNVGILSMYEPREWLEEVAVQKQPKLLVLPYPYTLDAEEPLRLESFGARLDKAILSGARGLRKYPRRTKLHWLRLLSPRYRNNFDVLEHPGYPETGQKQRHTVIFGAFVRHLAGYKYCFLCPSRADLEFLKFTECAYAGCVPVGAPASSLPREARELFLNEQELIQAVRSQPPAKRNREHFDRAKAYRQLMSACRRPEDLREQLNQFARTNF